MLHLSTALAPPRVPSVQISPTSHIGLKLTVMILFQTDNFQKDPVSKSSRTVRQQV